MQSILARLLTAAAVMLFRAPAMAQTCTGAYPGSCVFQDDGVPKEFPTLGENGGTAGSLKLAGSGTGYVLIQVPTGTITSYNLNLPATVGASGSFLTSAGGGTSAMTWTAQVPLNAGGTNANLTASNGGIFYSTATAGAILSGTSTAQQMLQSGSSAAPAWSTATWPATTTINQILYSSSANAVGGLATGNSSVLVTSPSGVPSLATAIPAGVTATTTAYAGDATAKIATNAFVQAANLLAMSTVPMAVSAGTYSFATVATINPTINHVAAGGAITSATVNAGGTGVAVGDLFLASGGNHDAILRVETISGSAAATLSVVYGGTGYTTTNGVTTDVGSAIPYTYLLSGALAGDVTIIATSGTYLTASQQWYFANNTTNAHTVTVCVSNGSDACSSGRTAVIPRGSANSCLAGVQTDGKLNVDIATLPPTCSGTTYASPIFTGAAGFADGTVGAPAITFSADLSSGLYRIGTHDIALATAGTKALEINSSQLVTIPSGLSVTTSFTATGLVTLADIATQNADTFVANATGSSASPTAITGATAEGLLLFTQSGTGAVQQSLDAKLKTYSRNVKDFGASGSSQTTTGTISGSSASLSLTSAIDFANGQGIRVNHAGAAFTENPPTLLTVTATGTTGSTHYQYQVASIDAAGGIGAAITAVAITNGHASLGATNYNALSWTAAAGGAAGYAVYGNVSGSMTLLAIVAATVYNDIGTAAITAPDIYPQTPPAAALADWLITTVSSGGGTTTLILAATATTAATSQTVAHDDTAAMQAGITAVNAAGGGVLSVPQGIYPVCGVTMPSLVYITGEGRGSTEIEARPGCNTDVFAGQNAYSLFGTINPGGIYDFAFRDLTIDGNWTPTTPYNLNGNCLAFYAYRYLLSNITLQHCPINFIRSEWNYGGIPTVGPDMDATVSGVMGNISGQHGFNFNGPHDSLFDKVIAVDASQLANNAYAGLVFGTVMNARINMYHGWHTGIFANRASTQFLSLGSGSDITNSHFEGSYGYVLQISGNNNNFGDSNKYYNGFDGKLILNQGASNTIHGLAFQDIGITPNVVALTMGDGSNAPINSNIDLITINALGGAIDFTYSGGSNNIRIANYQGSGAAYVSVPAAADTVDLTTIGGATGQNIHQHPGLLGISGAQCLGSPPVNSGSCAVKTQTGGTTCGFFQANGACVGGTLVFAMPYVAPTAWACDIKNITTTADSFVQTSFAATSVTVSGSAVDNDYLTFHCFAF